MTTQGEDETSWTGGAPADPMDTPRCIAIAKGTGQRCKRRPIPGGRVCVKHGGAAPAVRAAGLRRKAEAEAIALLETVWNPQAEPIRDPVEGLMRLAGRLEHAVDVLGAQLEVVGLDTPVAGAWTRTLRELRLALEGLERLDLEGKRVALAAAQADIIVDAFHVALAQVALLPADRSTIVTTFLGQLNKAVEPDPIVAGELEEPA